MSVVAGRTILVVEDEALVLAMLEDMLAELGAGRVLGTTNLDVALGLATGEIDIAILDVNIRDASIRPVADALRARGVPLVFATAYGPGIDTLAQGDPVIDKPYSKRRLELVLAARLGRGDSTSL